jgi:hypothetical protein
VAPSPILKKKATCESEALIIFSTRAKMKKEPAVTKKSMGQENSDGCVGFNGEIDFMQETNYAPQISNLLRRIFSIYGKSPINQ